MVDYEAAANTYITNVNPVFMGALGQTAGTESKLYQKYSHKLTEKLKDVYLDGFAEFVKYLSPTKWLSEVSNASLTGTLNGYNFTAESFAKQHSHYYITEALGACTYYESTSTECTSYGYCGYVGYCTMEDFYLYYYETNVAPAMFGGVTCTVYYNTTCTYIDTLGLQDLFIAFRGYENAEYISTHVNVDVDDTWGERGHLDNETMAWLYMLGEYDFFPLDQYHPGSTNGTSSWRKAIECAKEDFGSEFTESETFAAATGAYTAYGA